MALLLLQGCASGGHAAAPDGPGPSASGSPAPNFLLTDQFGHTQRLSTFRGKVVLLTFIDSRCTTLCPLTAQLMTETEQDLGPTYSLQLLAINANPDHTSISDVRRWSVEHRMLRRWYFLTGPLGELRTVWGSYGVQAKVVQGDVAHTSVIFLIDPAGRIQGYFPIAAQRHGISGEAVSIAHVVRLLVKNEA